MTHLFVQSLIEKENKQDPARIRTDRYLVTPTPIRYEIHILLLLNLNNCTIGQRDMSDHPGLNLKINLDGKPLIEAY